jgi:hypothetical protein
MVAKMVGFATNIISRKIKKLFFAKFSRKAVMNASTDISAG